MPAKQLSVQNCGWLFMTQNRGYRIVDQKKGSDIIQTNTCGADLWWHLTGSSNYWEAPGLEPYLQKNGTWRGEMKMVIKMRGVYGWIALIIRCKSMQKLGSGLRRCASLSRKRMPYQVHFNTRQAGWTLKRRGK